jgi:hypothetical protein
MVRCLYQKRSQNAAKNSQKARKVPFSLLLQKAIFGIILPFLIFLPLYSKDGRKSNAIVGWFASLIMFGIFGAITTWIAYQIPIIWNNPIWNYSLNFLIHTLFWVMVVKLGNDKNKKN